MAKKNNTIFWIIGIVVLFLVITNSQAPKETEDFTSLKVRYYDKDKNEIFPYLESQDAQSKLFVDFSIIGSVDDTQYSTSEISSKSDLISTDYYDQSLADDDGTESSIRYKDPFEQDDVGLRIIEEEDYAKPSFLENIVSQIKSLISQIGTFGIVTTTKSFRISSTATGTYCEDHRDGTFDYYGSELDYIGSDSHTDGSEECNGLIRFSGYSIPADLTSDTQITQLRLYIKTTTTIVSNEGNGVSVDFDFINNLGSYDWTPNDENEREIAFDRLEAVSTSYAATYDFQDSIDENKWFNFDVTTWFTEEDIVDKIQIGMGMEGEYDTSDNEYVDFYTHTAGSDAPYLIVYYTVTTCQPDTCSSLGKQCGSWPDGCGGTLNCGTCSEGYTCDVTGYCIEDIPEYIKLDVFGNNIGETSFTNMQIVNAEPSLFLTALQYGTTHSTTLAVGETNKLLFTSDFIDVAQLKALPQPVTFWVNVSGISEYTEAQISEQAELPWTPPSTLRNNLITYYKLDGISGVVVDSHGTNPGTNYGATRGVAGKIGNAFDFDGSTNYVNLGSPASLGITTMSISAWFKMAPGTANVGDMIVSKDDGTASGMQYRLGMYIATANAVEWSVGNHLPDCAYITDYDDGEWHHIVGTSDGITTRLYFDSLLVDTGSKGTQTTTAATEIGRRANNYGHFDGTIDDILIWNRALTQEEVTELYSSTYPF